MSQTRTQPGDQPQKSVVYSVPSKNWKKPVRWPAGKKSPDVGATVVPLWEAQGGFLCNVTGRGTVVFTQRELDCLDVKT